MKSTSSFSNPRVVRGPGPSNKLKNAQKYREWALPDLRKDFEDRCAYSLVHWKKVANANSTMEVDHFNPNLSDNKRNDYSNLMLATRRCNGAKSKLWPTNSETKKHGRRFLNPCVELEYGEHIVEHPGTHELIPLTPAGDYHVEILDLNNSDLIDARKERWLDLCYLESTTVRMKRKYDAGAFPLEVVNRYRDLTSTNIPLFPFATDEQVLAFEIRMCRISEDSIS